jgi:hypothetical protein
MSRNLSPEATFYSEKEELFDEGEPDIHSNEPIEDTPDKEESSTLDFVCDQKGGLPEEWSEGEFSAKNAYRFDGEQLLYPDGRSFTKDIEENGSPEDIQDHHLFLDRLRNQPDAPFAFRDLEISKGNTIELHVIVATFDGEYVNTEHFVNERPKETTEVLLSEAEPSSEDSEEVTTFDSVEENEMLTQATEDEVTPDALEAIATESEEEVALDTGSVVTAKEEQREIAVGNKPIFEELSLLVEEEIPTIEEIGSINEPMNIENLPVATPGPTESITQVKEEESLDTGISLVAIETVADMGQNPTETEEASNILNEIQEQVAPHKEVEIPVENAEENNLVLNAEPLANKEIAEVQTVTKEAYTVSKIVVEKEAEVPVQQERRQEGKIEQRKEPEEKGAQVKNTEAKVEEDIYVVENVEEVESEAVQEVPVEEARTIEADPLTEALTELFAEGTPGTSERKVEVTKEEAVVSTEEHKEDCTVSKGLSPELAFMMGFRPHSSARPAGTSASNDSESESRDPAVRTRDGITLVAA